MPEKVYLDANGNPAGGAPPVYLDPNTGEPITGHPDTRNWVQRQVDKLTTVTPEQEAGHSWLTNKAQEFGAGAIQGLTAPFVHPQQTAQAALDLAKAYVQPQLGAQAGRQMIDQTIQHPAQTAGNLVGGQLLGEVGGAVIPAAAKLVGKTAGRAALLGKTPEAAYESALKPSTTLSQADRAGIIQTGLSNEIPVSKAGGEKIQSLIDALDDARTAEIAKDPRRTISAVPALRNLNDVRARFANQVTPQPDLAEIDQVQSNFLNNPKVSPQGAGPGPSSIPAADAQAMKSGTYRTLGGKAYGELKGASVEAQKALARGLKDEIATQFPELNNLNAQESKLYDLQPVLERAINRTANHQLIGIGTPVAGAAAKAVTGSSGAGVVASTMKAVLDNPAVKSRLAIAVSKAQKIPYAQAAAKVQAYSSALGSTSGAIQAYSSASSPSQSDQPQP